MGFPHIGNYISTMQGGITCEAIDEPGKSSKAIDKPLLLGAIVLIGMKYEL